MTTNPEIIDNYEDDLPTLNDLEASHPNGLNTENLVPKLQFDLSRAKAELKEAKEAKEIAEEFVKFSKTSGYKKCIDQFLLKETIQVYWNAYNENPNREDRENILSKIAGLEHVKYTIEKIKDPVFIQNAESKITQLEDTIKQIEDKLVSFAAK